MPALLFSKPTSTAEKLRETPPFFNPPPRRRPYTRADYRYLAQHYAQATGPELAAVLNRTLGSLKGFIRANPELRKRGGTGRGGPKKSPVSPLSLMRANRVDPGFHWGKYSPLRGLPPEADQERFFLPKKTNYFT